MDETCWTERRRRIEIRRQAKAAAASCSGRGAAAKYRFERKTSLKRGSRTLQKYQPASSMSFDLLGCTSPTAVPSESSDDSNGDSETGNQRHVFGKSASTVSSVVSGVTTMVVCPPAPFSHEEFECSRQTPAVHGHEAIGRDSQLLDAVVPTCMGPHRLPLARQRGQEGNGGHHTSCPPHGAVSVCGRRRHMEDFVKIVPELTSVSESSGGDIHFFGVFDGHGGNQVSQFCAQHLHAVVGKECDKAFEDSQKTNLGSSWESRMQQAMTAAFLKVDADIGGAAEQGDSSYHSVAEAAGSTAVVVLVDGQRLTVANCGDSRAILSHRGITVPLTSDHKPYRADELKRVEVAGGWVIFCDGLRVCGILAMTRAIGDCFLKPFVIADPEVISIPRSVDDEFIILASDGLWDVVSNDIACEVVRRCIRCHRHSGVHLTEALESGYDSPCTFAAALLTKLALAAGSSDNISVVVIDLSIR